METKAHSEGKRKNKITGLVGKMIRLIFIFIRRTNFNFIWENMK